jgi:hypothetical protein
MEGKRMRVVWAAKHGFVEDKSLNSPHLCTFHHCISNRAIHKPVSAKKLNEIKPVLR